MADTTAGLGYPQPQPGLNPLQTLSEFSQIQGRLNQNELFQQEYAARKAMGPIYQSSIDPKTGEIDLTKLLIGVSTNPATAWKAQELMKDIVSREQSMAQIDLNRIDTASKKANIWAQTFAPFAREGQDFTLADARKFAASAYGSPGQPFDLKKDIIPWLTQMEAQFGPDGERSTKKQIEMNRAAQNMLLRGMEVKDQLGALYGQAQQIKAGGATKLAQIPLLPGQPVTDRGDVYDVPTTAERNAPQTIKLTKEQAAAMGPGFREGQEITTSAGMVRPLQTGSGAVVGPGGPRGAGFSGLGPTSQSPAEADFQKTRATKAADLEQGINEDAEVASNLLKRIKEIKKAGGETLIGGGTEAAKFISETVQAFSRLGGPEMQKSFQPMVDKLAGGNLASLQELDKLMSQTTVQQLRQDLTSGNRIAMLEFMTYLQKNVNLLSDPRTADRIYSFGEQLARDALDKQQSYTKQVKKSDFDPADFKATWNQELRDKGRFDTGESGFLGGNTGAGPGKKKSAAEYFK